MSRPGRGVPLWSLALCCVCACGERGYLLGAVPTVGEPPSAGSAGAAASAGPFDCTGLGNSAPSGSADVPFPRYLESFVDPDFGSRLTRVSGDPGTPVPGTDRIWERRNGTIWVAKQVFNADESLLYVHFGGPLLLDGQTYEVVRALDPPHIGTWHPLDPELMVFVTGSEVASYNVLTDVVETLFRAPGYTDFLQDYAEDKLSAAPRQSWARAGSRRE